MSTDEQDKEVSNGVVMVKSDCLDDWYVIEKAEHDGRMWLESDGPNSSVLRCSSRISNADVEGTAEHMLDIAKAIKSRKCSRHTRCAVSVDGDDVELWSPRNSTVRGLITLAQADVLAEQIFAALEARHDD